MATPQAIVLANTGRQLDSLQATIGWASLTVVLFASTAFAREETLTVLGMAIKTSEVFWYAAPFYFFVNIKCLDLLVRIGRMVRILDSDRLFVNCVNTIALHPFIANPYGYFGASTVGRFTGAKGLALLILLWWTAHASLLMYCEDFNALSVTLLVVFSVVGGLSLWTIYDFHRYVMCRLGRADKELHDEWQKLRDMRWLLFGIAMASGLTVAVAAWCVRELVR